AADDGDGQGLKHLGAGAEGEGEGQHAGDGGEGGHDDGAEAAAAGLDHGFQRIEAKGAKLLLGVEQEDAVFGDNADHHDEPHERRHVEGGVGDKQGEEDAGGGEQGGGQDGQRSGEVAQLEQQHQEPQHHRQHQHAGQVGERFLLLLVAAAVFDPDAGGQVQLGDGALHAGDAGAQVHPLEAGGHFDAALQIFAQDFGLAGEGGDLGQLAEGGGVAGGTDQHGVAHGVEREAIGGGETHPQRVGAVVGDDGELGGRPLQQRGGIRGHLGGGEAGVGGGRLVDVEDDGGAAGGVVHAVEHIHHARHFADGVGNFRGPVVQQVAVGVEELDHHRLGSVGEVADHVLQDLGEVNVELGIGVGDADAGVGDDVVNAARAVLLEQHRNIAGVGLGHGGQTQLHAGAARGALHFRDATQDALDALQHAVGFGERAAGRHDVVEDE